jgi:hypothetical protein
MFREAKRMSRREALTGKQILPARISRQAGDGVTPDQRLAVSTGVQQHPAGIPCQQHEPRESPEDTPASDACSPQEQDHRSVWTHDSRGEFLDKKMCGSTTNTMPASKEGRRGELLEGMSLGSGP